jgi:hypothetical protein
METTAPQLQGEHMRDTIDMAREAGFVLRAESVKGQSDWWECFDEAIEKLVALARDDEREAAQAEHEADKVIIEYHEATIKRLEAAILAEREALIGLLKGIDKTEVESADGWWETSSGAEFGAGILAAIRARGNT